ncbi:MAG: RagB/SusD family nutrient uptake outer membrane protein [Prevotella sp.]|nr:RagB/SusD family nutrient uptake outer membrane protein [Prevotella sp.]
MKKSFKYILFALLTATAFGTTSCTDYLEADAESVLQKEDAFKNFANFQGYIEVMYNVIPDVAKHYWVSSFNWGEDEVITTGNGEYLMGFQIDNGNYRSYFNNGACFLDRNWAVDQIQGSAGARFDKALWGGGWYAIRQANIGLQALEEGLLKDATKEQRDMIAGQLYFFRAWFYFQLTSYWGGLPYLTEPMEPTAQFNLPRDSYQECAEKMAADFQKAADLLPIDWDATSTGANTKGKNAFRPNKIWALSYLGKCLLYAGSPLMVNGQEATGDQYKYDATYCKRAADALGQVLQLVESGQTQYALVDFEDYSSLFYTKEQNWLMPGSTEAIMRSPTYGADSFWRQMNSYQLSTICNGDGIILCPAANYVNYFGMANGLPLNDPESTFDKTHPWKDRDPRFYNNFIYDGVKQIKAPSEDNKKYQYANLYEGGNCCDDPRKTSRTGYFNYKFIPIGANNDDADYGYGKATHFHLAWLRLADVYLMYAEAAAEGYGGAKGKSNNCSLTAEDAVNKIRERAGVADVNAKYTGTTDKFIDEVRRERAVELAFEGHRFNDLRRWKLLTVYPYNIKTTQKFDRAQELDTSVDPKENEVKNFREEVIIQRNFSAKHYWLPFKNDDVMISSEFKQNFGW